MTFAYAEQAFLFESHDASLVGIVTSPVADPDGGPAAARLGVLIVVGGPQYRAGSHRQFVLLARELAGRGFPTMRFDCSGMGDSSGAERAFTDRDGDIAAAIDAFVARVPGLDGVAIWGLCDAASAALLYAPRDPRVRHLVLLNPWVRSDAGLARTHLRHYYASRVLDGAFWRDVVRGRVGVLRAVLGFFRTLSTARTAAPREEAADFQTRMAQGWRSFTGDILLLCSGDDLTAREFIDHVARDAAWQGLVDQPRVARCDLVDADHTFSRAAWRDRVASETATWLEQRAVRPTVGRAAAARAPQGIAA